MDRSYVSGLLAVGGDWLWAVGLLVGAGMLGLFVQALLYWALRKVTRRISGKLPLRGALLRRLSGPLRLLLPVLFVYAVRPLIREELPVGGIELLGGILHVLFVSAVAWLLIAVLLAAEEAIAEHYTIDTPENLKARRLVTQMRILRRIATAVIVVLALGIILLRYEPFQELGTGILASAGVFGIVFGIAAQRTLGNVVAGVQIALTQPIRVDDVVIVEGDFGWVEEITLTYVVVRVWDRRRIVLPITHFVEKPFQNWTRTTSDLIGSVFLYVDYTTPVDEVREEMRRITERSEYWDGDVCVLHVTNATERAVELRGIASAQSAPELWELRCELRENLIAFLQEQHPEALPVLRAHLQEQGEAGATSTPEELP